MSNLLEYPVSPPADLYPERHTMYQATLEDAKTREKVLLLRVRNLWWLVGGLLVLQALTTEGLVHTAKNKTVIPFIYQLDGGGHLSEPAALQRGWKGDTTPPIEAAFKDWVYRMRRVGSDQPLLREQMLQAAAFMTEKAAQIAKPHWREVDKLVADGMVTTVMLGQVLPITPDFRSLELEWVETVYNQQGLVLPERSGKYKVIANLAVVPVTEITTAQQARNILGIFITDFSWRKVGKL